MATFEKISAAVAPAAVAKTQRSNEVKALLDALNNRKPDEALRITPDEGKNTRGIKTSLGRLRGTALTPYSFYEVEGVVYVVDPIADDTNEDD